MRGEGSVEPTLRVVINDNPAFAFLRAHGYEIVATSPAYEDVSLRHADRFVDGGEINEFEFYLLRTSVALDLVDSLAPDYLSAQHRQRILDGFDFIKSEASSPAPWPRFLFVHIPTPHLPVVFGAHGEPVRAENSLGFYSDFLAGRDLGEEEFKRLYRDQLAFLDGLAVQAVDSIIAADARAVVVVFSDHGVRAFFDQSDLGGTDLDAVFGNLVAARTPVRQGLYSGNVTAVNLLSTILNSYLGARFPTAPNRTFASGVSSPFELHEFPNPDAGG